MKKNVWGHFSRYLSNLTNVGLTTQHSSYSIVMVIAYLSWKVARYPTSWWNTDYFINYGILWLSTTTSNRKEMTMTSSTTSYTEYLLGIDYLSTLNVYSRSTSNSNRFSWAYLYTVPRLHQQHIIHLLGVSNIWIDDRDQQLSNIPAGDCNG